MIWWFKQKIKFSGHTFNFSLQVDFRLLLLPKVTARKSYLQSITSIFALFPFSPRVRVLGFVLFCFPEFNTETNRIITGYKYWGQNGAEKACSSLVGVETDLIS